MFEKLEEHFSQCSTGIGGKQCETKPSYILIGVLIALLLIIILLNWNKGRKIDEIPETILE